MECKFCNAPMEDDMTVCPACGKDVTEETAAEDTAAVEEAEELSEDTAACDCAEGEESTPAAAEEDTEEAAPAKKVSGKTILGWIIAIILVVAIAAAAMFVWKQYEAASVPVEDISLSGSETGYTVSAEEMTEEVANTVVASARKQTVWRQMAQTLGFGSEMTDGVTNAELAVYYWDSFYNFYNNYGFYAMMMGLDPTTMDVTPGIEEGQTWQEYFLSQALNLYRSQTAICETARKEGYTLPENMQTDLDAQLETLRAMEDLDERLLQIYGPGVTKEYYFTYLENQYIYSSYLTNMEETITYTDEDLAAHYDANAETYQAQGIFRDVELVDSETEANRIYDEWKAGEATESSFAALAVQYTTDPGSMDNGGLYENVFVGQMVPEFNDWCFDESRQVGDTGIVKTDYGHHIMYFVGHNDDETVNVRHILLQSSDPDAWKETVSADYVVHVVTEFIKTTSQSYTLDCDTSKIALALPEEVAAQG